MNNLTDNPDNLNIPNEFDENSLDHLFGDITDNRLAGDDKNKAGVPSGSASDDKSLNIDIFFGNKGLNNSNNDTDTGVRSPQNLEDNEKSDNSDDEQLTGLSHDQVIKKLQSLKDKAKQRVKQLESELDQLLPIKEVYNKIVEDPTVRRAFIAELEPELVKPTNPYDTVRQHLAEKFGADFVPDKEEASIPFTTSWEYIKEANELLEKFKTEQQTIKKTLTQIKEEQKELARKQAEQINGFKEKMKTKYRWTDETFQQFQRWGSKVGLEELGVFFDLLRKRTKQTPNRQFPSVANVSGNTMLPNEIKAELDKFFG